jgi:hypothetical protein
MKVIGIIPGKASRIFRAREINAKPDKMRSDVLAKGDQEILDFLDSNSALRSPQRWVSRSSS